MSHLFLGLLLAATGNIVELPDDFPVEAFIAGTSSAQARAGAEYAELLVQRGEPEDIVLAVRLLDAVIACQEQRDGARHQGNFVWSQDDEAIRDLNAVEFVMRHLIPMMLDHGDRLPADARERVLQCIRLAVDEIRRMDVAVTYTNIASMDCLNSCLGGELLGDAAIAERGYAKLKELADVTAANGTVYEFYSPGYTKVTIDAMHRLATRVRDEATAVRAHTLAARLALTTALHVHSETGFLTGPFSRAYYNEVTGDESEATYLREWIGDGIVPEWIGRVLDRKPPLPMQIDEASYAEWDMVASTYITASYSLGVSSREISSQSTGLIIRYPIDGTVSPGSIFSRYLLNDAWFEASDAPREGSRYFRLRNDGKFWGVQSGPRALYLCAPRTIAHPDSFAPCSRDLWHSAKEALIWSHPETVDAIWAGSRKIESLPADVNPGEVVVIASGPIYVGIMPLTRTDLGYGAPLRIAESNGQLAFQMYNYLGGDKVHNDLERMSRFYRGQPQCGYYLEVAERSEYEDGKAFGDTIARGALVDEAAPDFTVYQDDADRTWKVEYRRDGLVLGMEIDLMDWTLTRRWTEDGDLGYPMLESPVARQTGTGRVEVAGAVFECPAAPAWLYADPDADFFVAGYHGETGAVSLNLPNERIEIESMGTGTVVYNAGDVRIDALGTPTVTQRGRT
jgi:hypothetical protein